MIKFLRGLLTSWLPQPALIELPRVASKPVPQVETVPIPTIPKPVKPPPVHKYPTVFEALAEVQEGKCFHCANQMVITTTVKTRRQRQIVDTNRHCSKEHIIPVSEQRARGWHIPSFENCVLACEKCNRDRRSDPMSESDLALAKEINAVALHLYRTEIVYGERNAAPRIFGVANPNERELRHLQENNWRYLFKDAVRMSVSRPRPGKLSRAAANQLRKARAVRESSDHTPVQLPPAKVGRAHPKTILDFIFPVHASNEKVNRGSVELGVP